MAKTTQPKNLILGLETSTHAGGASILAPDDSPTAPSGSLIGTVSFTTRQLYSQRLMPSIEWLLTHTQTTMPDIAVIGIAIGPGSFTGLRIGLSVAKALAYASDAKMVGVSTLEALAVRASNVHSTHPICTILDARHGQVYAAIYQVHWSNGRPQTQKIRPPWAGPIEEITPWITEPTIFTGEALPLVQEKLADKLGTKFLPAPPHQRLPHPEAVAMLTSARAHADAYDDPINLEPQYVRQSYTSTNPNPTNSTSS